MDEELKKDLKELIKALKNQSKSSRRDNTQTTAVDSDSNKTRDEEAELLDEINAKLADYQKKIQDTTKIKEEAKKISGETYAATEAQIEAEEEILRLEKEKYETLLAMKLAGKDLGPEREKELKDLGEKLKKLDKEKEAKEKISSIGKEIGVELKKQAEEQEKMLLNLGKLTGGYQGFFSEMSEASRIVVANTLATGITGEQAQKALGDLAAGFTNLKAYGAEAAGEMATVTAEMEKVGISGQIASKSFDVLVNSMGKTSKEAGRIQESFVQMAAKNKMSLSSVTEAFAENASRFVGYGEQMTKVLDGLAKQSLETGIKIQGLIGIAQGFDTFEDSARKVGSLNAMLGGDYLNSVEMLTASDEERIKMLQEGVRASGMQWDSMNRFQKMAIANAAGIKDLTEAGKMFGNNLNNNNALMQDQAAVQKTLAEQAENASLASDKLKSTLNGLLIVVQPIATVLMTLVGWLASFVQGINEIIQKIGLGSQASAAITSVIVYGIYKIITGFTKLGGMFTYISGKMSGFIASLRASSVATAEAAAAQTAAEPAVASSGATAAAASKGYMQLGFAILMIGAGIGLAALGIAQMVMAFKGLGDAAWPAVAAITILSLAFYGMISVLAAMSFSGVGWAAVGLMLAVGAAALMIGGGMKMAAEGMATFVASFKDIGDLADKVVGLNTFIENITEEKIKIVNNLATAFESLAFSLSLISANADVLNTLGGMLGINLSGETTTATAQGSITASKVEISAPEPIPVYITTPTVKGGETAAATSAGSSVVVPVQLTLNDKVLFEIMDSRATEIAERKSLETQQRVVNGGYGSAGSSFNTPFSRK